MEIRNNYQPNFKSVYITKNAHEILSNRLSSGEYVKLKDEFINKFKDSKLFVKLDALNQDSHRLDAIISYNIGNTNPKVDDYFDYLEESTFASIFKSPAKFIQKIVNAYEKKAVPFLNNGCKKID